MKFGLDAKTVSIVGATAFAAVIVAAAPASAEPGPPPPPAPVPAPVLLPPPAPLGAPMPLEAPAPLPPPTPLESEVPAQGLGAGIADPAVEGVPHLLSLENLPPGTSDAPVSPSQPRLTYFKDLWHAMRTQEVSGGDALLLLTQRPMVADARPPAGMPAGPQAPLPAAPPPVEALPAPVSAPFVP